MCFKPKWTLLLGFSAAFHVIDVALLKILSPLDFCDTTFLDSLCLIFLCFHHGLHFLCLSLKYLFFNVFSEHFFLFFNVSNWVISSTLIFMVMTLIYGPLSTYSEIQSSISNAINASHLMSRRQFTYHTQNKCIFLPRLHVTCFPVFLINVIIRLVTIQKLRHLPKPNHPDTTAQILHVALLSLRSFMAPFVWGDFFLEVNTFSFDFISGRWMLGVKSRPGIYWSLGVNGLT